MQMKVINPTTGVSISYVDVLYVNNLFDLDADCEATSRTAVVALRIATASAVAEQEKAFSSSPSSPSCTSCSAK